MKKTMMTMVLLLFVAMTVSAQCGKADCCCKEKCCCKTAECCKKEDCKKG